MNYSAEDLIEVGSSDEVWNGITTSDNGRLFVNYPRLEGDAGKRIGEVLPDQTVIPYPDASWNDWKQGKEVSHKFVRTNSLRIGPDGLLWIVDTGTAAMGEPAIPGAAKLVAVDIETNEVVRIIPLDPVMKPNSFIDDLRIFGEYIFITDAGSPALAVLEYNTGNGRRLLEDHRSTTDERPIYAEGKIMKTKDGKEVKVHADQLEVSPDGKIFYFQPASGPLYRIEMRYLLDQTIDKDTLAGHITEFYDTPSTGGTAIDGDGNIYVSDVNQLELIRITPEGKKEVILRDLRLTWGDALWIDKDGWLWIPEAQLNRLSVFQNGTSEVKPPLHLYKINIGAKPFRN